MNTAREYVELFHLLFLDQLARNLDHSLYAVKGGCNLRFFFNSIRYSEDLDIDVKTIAVETLKNKINKILTCAPFQHILKTRHLVIESKSMPKQTETTQHWKVTLQTSLPFTLHTKIEFSRQGVEEVMLYDSVESTILQHYHLTPIFCTHYNKTFAFRQKIEALAGRRETQARDVFDLFFLSKTGINFLDEKIFKTEFIAQAQNNALSISYSDFKAQVISFLSPEYQKQYDSRQIWEKMLLEVRQQLERLKK